MGQPSKNQLKNNKEKAFKGPQAQQGKMRQAQQAHIVFHKGQIRVEGLSLNKEQKGTKSNSKGRNYMEKEEGKA